MTPIFTQKREAYSDIYNRLNNIQKAYQSMIKYFAKEAGATIPKNLDQLDLLDKLEGQIETAELNIERFEQIKYWSNLALLSDGGLVSDEEIATTMLYIEQALEAANDELTVDDELLQRWASNKKAVLEELYTVLSELLDYKTKKKLDRGEIKIQ